MGLLRRFSLVPVGLFFTLLMVGCAKNGARVELSAAAQRSEAALAALASEVAQLKTELAQREAVVAATANPVANETTTTRDPILAEASQPNCRHGYGEGAGAITASGDASLDALRIRVRELESKLLVKRTANTVISANMRLLEQEFAGHTNLHSLAGGYRVLVIPVEFQDVKFADREFLETRAQDYLFGNDPETLTSYYLHASLGKLRVGGEVTPVISVNGTLAEYGEAVTGNADAGARDLVVQALMKLREQRGNDDWWAEFDNWDLNDYDLDNHRREPDGFIDAVVLITAGKPQSSCQSAFDLDRSRPASADVPPGPRRDATVECYNRLWPHRWSIALRSDDPLYSARGPVLEGTVRPAMNGLKITENLFALDYNMQSEFSDRSTFIHEFGHSLTLPDIYDGRGPGNSTAEWEAMSGSAHLQAQEMSTYSKVSLGWVEPKVIRRGQATSAYLGNFNFVSPEQRENRDAYQGPEKVLESFVGADGVSDTHSYDVVSLTPGFGEPVYRAAVALMGPSIELTPVVEVPEASGEFAAYSGRFDGAAKSLKLTMRVPDEGDATLRFDSIHSIETETNFDSREQQIRVTTDFDLGSILINGELKKELRLNSGDANFDSLVEADASCEVARVLELRTKRIESQLTEAEQSEFTEKLGLCRKPVWVQHSFDLAALRGQDVEVEIRYITDGGYTEFGIVADNFVLGGQRVDFESASGRSLGDFALLRRGQVEVSHNQFYLFEHRAPSADYRDARGASTSYNLDRFISPGLQAMFQPGEGPLSERVRLVDTKYQDGLLVWYFNSRFDRRSNSPALDAGKGYLLVLNSQVQELPLPGALGAQELFDAEGAYAVDSPAYKSFVAEQVRLFKCFTATGYYTYLDGVAPDCQGIAETELNKMRELRYQGLRLVDRREGINEILPVQQYGYEGVGQPMRNSVFFRAATATFRPAESPAFKPFTVYRVGEEGNFVVDTELTAASFSVAPVSRFRDRENQLASNPRFHGDTVVVEKKGFGFDVIAPSPRITRLYDAAASAEANQHEHRKPRVKLQFVWE